MTEILTLSDAIAIVRRVQSEIANDSPGDAQVLMTAVDDLDFVLWNQNPDEYVDDEEEPPDDSTYNCVNCERIIAHRGLCDSCSMDVHLCECGRPIDNTSWTDRCSYCRSRNPNGDLAPERKQGMDGNEYDHYPERVRVRV